jgi:hypothetical protein
VGGRSPRRRSGATDMITPYKTDHENITSKINGSKLVFSFLEKPKLEILI